MKPALREVWELQSKKLQERFPSFLGKKFFSFKVNPGLEVPREYLLEVLSFLKNEEGFQCDTLVDLTAVDLQVDPRFEVLYQLASSTTDCRLTVKVKVPEGQDVRSVVSLWAGAHWAEREVYDLLGISFKGHPDLRRILMDPTWKGHPLRKDYPLQTSFQPVFTPPSSSDSVILGPCQKGLDQPLKLTLKLKEGHVDQCECEIGYTHRGKEKLGEHQDYSGFAVYTERLNPHGALISNIAYVMAVEKMMKLEIPNRCIWIRMIGCEFARILDHLKSLETGMVHLGLQTFSTPLVLLREKAHQLLEELSGARVHPFYARIGGVVSDLSLGFRKDLKEWVLQTHQEIQQVEKRVIRDPLWKKRTQGIGVLSKQQCLQYGFSGPCARASGLNRDLRLQDSSLFYQKLDFKIPLGQRGDVYDRYWIRLEEVKQSLSLLIQCDEQLTPGPIWTRDPRVPCREAQSFEVPAGEGYFAFESANGELGYYLVSRGGPKAYRIRIRGPSFWHLQGLNSLVQGEALEDVITILKSLNIVIGELDR